MEKVAISVTEAARNFSDCVNRARYQNVTFLLLKNGSPVARLAPANEKTCTGRSLAEALAQVELPGDEARTWREELKASRNNLSAPDNKWP
jgi:antitoxin (DNA-binding transcriptional repressor) of toxin-antitoxin stability system